jgi:hypothetical protein
MVSLARLAALCCALVALLVPAAFAAKPEDEKDKPNKPDAPGQQDTPGNSGNGNGNGNAEGDQGKPDKPEKDKDKGKDKDTGEPAIPGTPSPAPAGPPAPVGPEAPHPEHTALGQTVAAGVSEGTVRIKLPGSNEFTTLPSDQAIPVGASIDATEGLAEIGSETADGIEQHAVMTGAVFRVEQDTAAGGVTDLVLEGGDFSACGDRKPTARAARKGERKGNIVRGLWGAGKGKFRTRGRHSVASVRGTRWATVDRCHSTTIRVFDGVVDVKDLLTGKTVVLRAGDRHVVRAP